MCMKVKRIEDPITKKLSAISTTVTVLSFAKLLDHHRHLLDVLCIMQNRNSSKAFK